MEKRCASVAEPVLLRVRFAGICSAVWRGNRFKRIAGLWCAGAEGKKPRACVVCPNPGNRGKCEWPASL